MVREFKKKSQLGTSKIQLKMGTPVTVNLGFAVWEAGNPIPVAKGKAKQMKFTLLDPVYSW